MDDEPMEDDVPHFPTYRRRGVIPGNRGYSNDPATYESDLWAEELEHVLYDSAELQEALEEEGHDREIAKAVAWLYQHSSRLTGAEDDRAQLDQLCSAVELAVKRCLERRRRDAVIY